MRKEERVTYILDQVRQLKPLSLIRVECIRAWKITRKTWADYMDSVNDIMGDVVLETAKNAKSEILMHLDRLLQECEKEEGGWKVSDVLAVLKAKRELLGTDEPTKSVVESTNKTVFEALGVVEAIHAGS